MEGTLTRVAGGAALRTPAVKGFCTPPVVGERFHMVAPALEERDDVDGRFVETSPVMTVSRYESSEGVSYRFLTRSGSVYDLVFT